MILDDLLDFIEQKRILLAASALREVFFFFFFFLTPSRPLSQLIDSFMSVAG